MCPGGRFHPLTRRPPARSTPGRPCADTETCSQAGSQGTLTIIKDGSALTTSTLTSDQANGIDCVESSANLNTLAPGVYEFKLTTANGDTVSDGTLTVK
jgi:hypothetical protein